MGNDESIGESACRTIASLVSQHGLTALQMMAGITKSPEDEELIRRINSLEAKNPKANKDVISSNPHGVIFGKQYHQYIIKPEVMGHHVMVIGGTGTGKSSCIVIPTLRYWNGSVFAIDIKCELYENTCVYRKKIKVFAPQDKHSRYGYDPYFFLKNSDDSAQEARAIAEAIIPLSHNEREPFWIQSAQTMLTGAILHFYDAGESFIGTLNEILDLTPRELITIVADSDNDKAGRCMRSFVGIDDRTLISIYPHLSNAIEAIVNNDKLNVALSREDVITPEDLENGTDVYLQIPDYLL
jgi:hypothetical protein